MQKKKLTSALLAFLLVLMQALPVFADATQSSVDYYYVTNENINNVDKNTEVEIESSTSFSVTIPKKITLPGAPDAEGKHETSYSLTVKGDISGQDSIKVEPESTVTLSQAGKDDVVATVEQGTTIYKLTTGASVVTDGNTKALPLLTLKGGYLDENIGKVTAENLKAGDWSGTYHYNISLDSKGKTDPLLASALKFNSDGDFTLSASKRWDGTLEYSNDNGNTWTEWDGGQLSGTASQPIYLRGTGNTIITTNGSTWTFTGKYCEGNIENLLDYQTVANGEHPVMASYCYQYMFQGCTSLTTAPELPATTLADSCYSYMFNGCTSLTTAPALPATTLADSCYSYMFQSCTSLTTAPSLSATTLAKNCCLNMFCNCTSLTTAPALSATTLANSCYQCMFQNCTSLATAPELPATTLDYTCYSYMFSGCTSLATAPALPATTLDYTCYAYMFDGCTSLTTAPALPATTLAGYCYNRMFYGCTSLKISTSQTSEYQYEYRIPMTGTGTDEFNSALDDMFSETGGTFTSTPTINTTYYTTNPPVK